MDTLHQETCKTKKLALLRAQGLKEREGGTWSVIYSNNEYWVESGVPLIRSWETLVKTY
jgi:hypothetical protein